MYSGADAVAKAEEETVCDTLAEPVEEVVFVSVRVDVAVSLGLEEEDPVPVGEGEEVRVDVLVDPTSIVGTAVFEEENEDNELSVDVIVGTSFT